jgi:hypothetical protein
VQEEGGLTRRSQHGLRQVPCYSGGEEAEGAVCSLAWFLIGILLEKGAGR